MRESTSVVLVFKHRPSGIKVLLTYSPFRNNVYKKKVKKCLNNPTVSIVSALISDTQIQLFMGKLPPWWLSRETKALGMPPNTKQKYIKFFRRPQNQVVMLFKEWAEKYL